MTGQPRVDYIKAMMLERAAELHQRIAAISDKTHFNESDVLNTMAMARAEATFMALVGYITEPKDDDDAPT